MGANPWSAIKAVREKLNLKVAALQIPIGESDTLKGIVDILTEKAHYFEGLKG